MTTLAEYLQEIEDLKAIAERMWLDQQTTMPPAALTERVRQAGLLQALIQERLTSDRLAELLETAKGDEPWLQVVKHEREKALRLGDSTWKKFLETGAEAFGVWEKARREDDWDTFHPWLAKMVEINHEFASKVGYDEHPMDALLSTYVPGPTKNEIAAVLGELRDFLIEARQKRVVTGEALKEMAEPHVLVAIAEDIGHLIGYDFDRGGIAFSPHGYTSTASPNDVRITFRKDVPLFEAVSTVVHEYGHALYGQGIAKELWGTPAQYGAMPYIQESQAKFWENIVGRREDFCMIVGEILEMRVGRGRSAEEWGRLYHQSQTAAPGSPIRIATDEVAFNLHILLRFEIEVDLLDGKVTTAEVPELWNAKSEAYLGLVPSSLKEGALQDPHWTRRFFGLFTAYTVGNIASAQLAAAMEGSGVSLADAAARRDFSDVLEWLRENVHAPGLTVSVQEMLVRATGEPMNAEPYRKHIADRYLG
jgi:carboxypeptidase Taq